MAYDYWLSSEKMTVCVTVNSEGKIIGGPPIVRSFIGQPLPNLQRWLDRQGGFICKQLDIPE